MNMDYLVEIKKAAERSRDITRQLLAFSRKQILSPEVLDLNELISSSEKALVRLIGEDVDFRFTPKEGLWRVKVDALQVDQILFNLAINAHDAMVNGGKLTIETQNVVLDEDYCRDHDGYTPGQYVMVGVSDTGCGMDASTLANVFEPFYTTKELGKGTGLGLSTVYGIVKQSNGFINVYSEPQHGTTFKIYLPRSFEGMEEDSAERKPLPGGEGNILLVEDDDMVRQTITATLKKLGYHVIVAETPAEALEICGRAEAEVDVLLTDVVMPGMDGKQLKDKIESISPGIRTLFMSGYTSEAISHRGVLDEGVNFIQKPFTNHELAVKVHKVKFGEPSGS
jgi:CheY-like chemotaxis protein